MFVDNYQNQKSQYSQTAEFDLKQAVAVANEIVYERNQKHLSDVEIAVLKGAWNREDYDSIAVHNKYSTSYISQDVAPKLWRLLSEMLGEKIRKSNFKEALQRYQQNKKNRAACGKSNTDIPQANTSSPSDFYVERADVESFCCQTLAQSGGLLRLKGARLLGKTSLMNKVLPKMSNRGYATVSLSLKLADRNTQFVSLDGFLRWFCSNLSLELDLPIKLDEYWDEKHLGAKVSCSIYLRNYILPELDRPLVLCLDDVDLLFPYPQIYEDFFALLRSWYEKARTRELWSNLRLAIVHATDIYCKLNIYQSPFNVGLPQNLPEFSPQQARELADKYQVDLDLIELASIMNLVGGHPFLLQRAFELLRNDRTLTMEDLLAEATTESGIYSNHLRKLWVDLQQNPELSATFTQLLVARTPQLLDPVKAYQLQNLGLIELSGNQATPRCQLYTKYFSEYLNVG